MALKIGDIRLAAVRADLIQTLALFKEINPEFNPDNPVAITTVYGRPRTYATFYDVPVTSGISDPVHNFSLIVEALQYVVMESLKILFEPFEAEVGFGTSARTIRVVVSAAKMANLEYLYAQGFRQTNLFSPPYSPQLPEYFMRFFNHRGYGVVTTANHEFSRYTILITLLPNLQVVQALTFPTLDHIRGKIALLKTQGSEADYQRRLKLAFGEVG